MWKARLEELKREGTLHQTQQKRRRSFWKSFAVIWLSIALLGYGCEARKPNESAAKGLFGKKAEPAPEPVASGPVSPLQEGYQQRFCFYEKMGSRKLLGVADLKLMGPLNLDQVATAWLFRSWILPSKGGQLPSFLQQAVEASPFEFSAARVYSYDNPKQPLDFSFPLRKEDVKKPVTLPETGHSFWPTVRAEAKLHEGLDLDESDPATWKWYIYAIFTMPVSQESRNYAYRSIAVPCDENNQRIETAYRRSAEPLAKFTLPVIPRSAEGADE